MKKISLSPFELIILNYKLSGNRYLSDEKGNCEIEEDKLMNHFTKLLDEAKKKLEGETIPAGLKKIDDIF